jgi:hypothetical protein
MMNLDAGGLSGPVAKNSARHNWGAGANPVRTLSGHANRFSAAMPALNWSTVAIRLAHRKEAVIGGDAP